MENRKENQLKTERRAVKKRITVKFFSLSINNKASKHEGVFDVFLYPKRKYRRRKWKKKN